MSQWADPVHNHLATPTNLSKQDLAALAKMARIHAEAYRYRVIRQDDVFFILIHEAPDACGNAFIGVDTGARYAVSLEGRILRRSVGAEPEALPPPPEADAGVLEGLPSDGGSP
ncbi:hypothetical protein [Corallococcus sp. EGB]|uniref:hypothetical protein n=1 Tax=Corallococcus sp. EGB TaxID=1521117 RepID=UPI001CC10724|nr:hypothetical protein [Corallococcus sp. EGB]